MVTVIVDILEPDGVRAVRAVVQQIAHLAAGKVGGLQSWTRLASRGNAMGFVTTDQLVAVRVAPFEPGATGHVAADVSCSAGFQRVFETKTVPDYGMVEHIAHNGSRHTGLVANQRAFPDRAVGDESVTPQASGNTAQTCIAVHTRDGHLLHAEPGHRSCDGTEDTRHQCTRSGFHFTTGNAVSATVVVAVKDTGTLANRFPIAAVHIDVGSLKEVDARALIAVITIFGYLLQIGKAADAVGVLRSTATGECVDSQGLVGVFPVFAVHTAAFIVKHGIGIGVRLSRQVLIPSGAIRRTAGAHRSLIVQHPCDCATGHSVCADVNLTAGGLAAIVGSDTSSTGETPVDRGILLDDATEASGMFATEVVGGLKAMTHTGILFHLAHHTTHVGATDGVACGIAVLHAACTRQFIPVLHQHTGNGSTAVVRFATLDGHLLDSQVVDRAHHPSEDADACADVGHGGLTDQVAAAVVVALKRPGMADRRPAVTPSGVLQHIVDNDVALLAEPYSTGVAAARHVVSQRQQPGILNDERGVLRSLTLREQILILFPLTIDISGSTAYRAFVVCRHLRAAAVFVAAPLQQIFFRVGQPQRVVCRNGDCGGAGIDIRPVTGLARFL